MSNMKPLRLHQVTSSLKQSCEKFMVLRASKVRGQTPKVAKQDKRMQHNCRFVTAMVGFGKKRGRNSSEK
ncbi:hypothetical protein M0R45_018683 [Rubus argutus]|uniref:40S ribosomal protein S30 n=1 Tax=Rubus argutus TaxID=59490 RepID=A0AAW1X441_RUBAR